MIKRKNVRRVGLLTEQEKINIQSGNINKKTLSKLYTKLNKRLKGYTEDFEIIAKSPHLKAWRANNETLLEHFIRADMKASIISQPTYTIPIKYFTKKK